MAEQYDIKGKWTTDGVGHVYRCKAVSKTGRILGKVDVTADIDEMANLEQYLPEDPRKAIESSAQETLRNLVTARYGK
jgi:hypothetical protein